MSTFEAQFIKKLSNTEVELKKSVAYKKGCNNSKIRYLMSSNSKSKDLVVLFKTGLSSFMRAAEHMSVSNLTGKRLKI